MAELLYIQATTLQEIIDAIEASGYVTVRIQLSPPNADGYIIAKKLLKKIADEVRAFDGTIAEILIKELAKRILFKKVIKLATPVIALYDENGIISPSYDTTAILGKAILGYAILGDSGNLVKLDTPVIYLVDEDAVPVQKLATPVIYLYDDSVEDDPVIEQLATPVVKLVETKDYITKMYFDNDGIINASGEIVAIDEKRYSDIVAIEDLADGDDGYCVQSFDIYYTEYPKLLFFSDASLSSFIKGLTVEEIGNKERLTVAEIQALAATVDGATHIAFNSDYESGGIGSDFAYIYTNVEPVKPDDSVKKLATPVIELVEVKEETEEPDVPIEPTVKQLTTPVIYLEVIEDETEDPDVPVEPTIIQLTTPVIYLEEVTDGEDEPDVPYGLVKMTYNSSGYIDGNGEFFEPSLGYLKYSQLISLWMLANGSDGWCVWSEFSEPTEIKIFYYDDDNKLVGTLGYEDYLSRGLTAEFIVNYAVKNFPTATQAIFTLDPTAYDAVDAIYVYEVEEEEEYKLATPVIELVEVAEIETVYKNLTVTSANRNLVGYTSADATILKLTIPSTVTVTEGTVRTVYTVTEISATAFSNCDNIKAISLPDTVTSIGYQAFYGCDGLTSIELPNSITSITAFAFQNCTSLVSVTIPNKISTLDISTFAGCSSLQSVTIPSSVRTIRQNAFQNCSALREIHYNADSTNWDAITKESGWDTGAGDYTIYFADGTSRN